MSSSESSTNDNFIRTCSRCRNHGIYAKLKGHKRYCKYVNCDCVKCLATMKHQRLSAEQTATRRAQKLDERWLLEIGEVLPIVNEPVAHQIDQTFAENTLDNNQHPTVPYPTEEYNEVPENFQHPSFSMTYQSSYSENSELINLIELMCIQCFDLLDSNDIYNMALRVSKHIGYPYECVPLFCALVKLANRDESVVLGALEEGNIIEIND